MFLLLSLLARSACAQPAENITVEAGTFDRLVPLVAPEARCVALSEAQNLIAFGHDKTWKEAQITMYRLNSTGQPIFPATSWQLPCPEVFQKQGTYPIGLAFHPKLPLLYVWNELSVHFTNPPTTETDDVRKFDHLLIYDVAKSPPELLVSLCRGSEYLYGQNGAPLAVDPEGTFLCIASLRDLKNAGSWRFGRFSLDADGLPKVVDEKLPREEKIKKIVEWNATPAATPTEKTPFEYVYLFPGNHFGSVGNFHIENKGTILAGGATGVMCWRPDDPNVTLSGLPIRKHSMTFLARHPKLPLVYASKHQGDGVFRVQFIDGYWSLVPRGWTIPEVKLISPPVMLRDKHLAVAGAYQVYIFPLDDQGNVRGPATSVQLLSPTGRTLVYSDKFDKLYAGVDLSK
jgi:hypothetical protein